MLITESKTVCVYTFLFYIIVTKGNGAFTNRADRLSWYNSIVNYTICIDKHRIHKSANVVSTDKFMVVDKTVAVNVELSLIHI